MTTSTGGDPEPRAGRALRRDAEENRLRVIRAAREVFAAQGLGAGFNDIARHAGVGVGTVYRRFPDKATLVREALEEPLARILEVADDAIATEPAWDGLMLLIRHAADVLAANLGLRDIALGPGQLAPELDEAAGRVAPYLEELLRRAQDEGSVRPGITAQDFTMLFFMISELAMHAADTRPQAYRRYLTIFTDGLRASGADAPLPEPLSAQDADAVARHWTSRA
ncbi:TetR/AcrR family transcriptional regulator [Georgenia wangjunii]|uniref:TetR/AcrR family transcriptional regulator n=1 Tax=Georgenia wangjunii TaxID=3117730 RepID=UPI002F262732